LKRRDGLTPDFEELCLGLEDGGTEQANLSTFLKTVEQCARYPSLTIAGMNPLRVEQVDNFSHYRVKLLVSATLPDLIRFISDLTQKSAVTGIDTFRIRAIDSGRAVECSLTLHTIRFLKNRRDGQIKRVAVSGRTSDA
jgi:hypothetical protein